MGRVFAQAKGAEQSGVADWTWHLCRQVAAPVARPDHCMAPEVAGIAIYPTEHSNLRGSSPGMLRNVFRKWYNPWGSEPYVKLPNHIMYLYHHVSSIWIHLEADLLRLPQITKMAGRHYAQPLYSVCCLSEIKMKRLAFVKARFPK